MNPGKTLERMAIVGALCGWLASVGSDAAICGAVAVAVLASLLGFVGGGSGS